MIYTNSDGGARGNPGPGAVGIIVRNERDILLKHSEYIGEDVTNNIAEYTALIRALDLASQFGKEITCVLDSELVVKQLLGQYKVKNRALLGLFLQVQKLQEKFDKIKYLHSSRWDNFQQMADELVNAELDKRGFKKKFRRR